MDNAAHMSEEIRSEYMKENYEDILELASGEKTGQCWPGGCRTAGL